MELDIFTCVCLFDHLIMMKDESKEEIISKIFSIINRPNTTCITFYVNKIFCFCSRCMDILEVENNCRNCAYLFHDKLKKYLIKIKK